MCKTSKPAISNSIQAMAEPYLSRKKDFLDLKFTNPIDQSIALYCLDNDTAFVTQLNPKTESHLELLKKWVIKNYQNYITLLNIEKDNDELLNLYLYIKFKKELENGRKSDNPAQFFKEINLIKKNSTDKSTDN